MTYVRLCSFNRLFSRLHLRRCCQLVARYQVMKARGAFRGNFLKNSNAEHRVSGLF